jgi:hypothetical protein
MYPLTFIAEAVDFLKDAENPDTRLMRNLMSIIYHLERAEFELLIENILLKKHGLLTYRAYESDYAEYRPQGSDLERHRAYLLFTPDDFTANIAIAASDPYVSALFIYAQEGYEPKSKKLRQLAARGINITYATVHELAQDVLRRDLVRWIIAVASKTPQRLDSIVKDCLLGMGCRPGIHDAMIFLLEQLTEADFSHASHGIFIRQGYAGTQTITADGNEFIGVDANSRPFYFRTQKHPEPADFEAFYQTILAKKIVTPTLRGCFCHLSDHSSDFHEREAMRAPGLPFCDIDTRNALQLVNTDNASSWLRRWLIQRFDNHNTAA